MLSSALVQLPQVFKILFGNSALGISFISVFLDLLGLTISGLYSYSSKFPFSAYGELVFIGAQTFLIVMMVVWYTSGLLFSLLFMALYGAGIYIGMDPDLCPVSVLWYGQALNIPMIIVGKSMQIWANFSNGHTGQLSAITTFLGLGTITRIFTSIQETGDPTVIATSVIISAFNAIVALQVLWYWEATNKVLSKKSYKKTD